MCHRLASNDRNVFWVDEGCHPQTIAVMSTRAEPTGIEVKVGDAVAKEQVLGRSGATGLALGDHLHYEVLVSGISVTPLEWWDAKWIRDRINKPLKDAGLPEIAGLDRAASSDSSAASDEKPKPPRRRRR